MWSAGQHSITWTGAGNTLSFPIFFPDYALFSGEIFSLPKTYEQELGYDDWIQEYPRDTEIQMVADVIHSLHKSPRRVHIRGISCIESVELIRHYYASLGYEDIFAKNYLLPDGVSLTVSLSLRSLLWCEKDKHFLTTKDSNNHSYYAVLPPLRSPRDLRALQQGARMNVIMGVEVGYDELFLIKILEQQILTVFQMTRLCGGNWARFGFSGSEKIYTLDLPSFLAESFDTVG